MLDDLAQAADVDKTQLPAAVEGILPAATRALPDNPRLRQTLGLLAVSRKPLSLLELSQLTGASQRAVDLEGIQPIRQFLTVSRDALAFYHERLHDFVVPELVYGDELREYHSKFVAWNERTTCAIQRLLLVVAGVPLSRRRRQRPARAAR